MSKLTIISEDKGLKRLNSSTKADVDATEYLLFKYGLMCFSSHFARLYSGVFIADITGLRGQFILWCFAVPYNLPGWEPFGKICQYVFCRLQVF